MQNEVKKYKNIQDANTARTDLIEVDSIENLVGCTLQNRFRIGQYVDHGAKGSVFECFDL